MKLTRGVAGAIACWLWLAVCLIFLGWRFLQGIPVDTDIRSMLPSGGGTAVDRAANDLATRAAAGRTAILVSAAEPGVATEAGKDLTAALQATGIYLADERDVETTGRWLFANRNELICQNDPKAFDAAVGRKLARQALADVYSPTGTVTGDLLQTDPFLLTVRLAECLAPVSAPSGAAQLVSGRIDASAFRMDTEEAVVKTVETWKTKWAAKGVTAARAGAVFHASAAAQSTQADITLIGTIGTIGVAILFFLVFRTMRSVIVAMVLVAIGLAAGTAAALIVFPAIHVLVFVFAAMLVGIVSDYAVHTLASGPATGWAPTAERLALVGRPITVSMVTAVLGFSSLALFGTQMFEQVALLSGVGIATAWAFVLFVLTPMDQRPKNAEVLLKWWTKAEDIREAVRIPGWVTWGVAAIVVAITVYGANQMKFLDDVRQFQPRPADLMAEEAVVRSAGYAGSGVTFLLSRGADMEEAKRHEEAAIAEAPAGVRLLATTRFDPSKDHRAANVEALRTGLFEPYLAQHLEQLGLDPPATAPPVEAAKPSWMADLTGTADGQTFLIAPLLDPAGWAGPNVEGVSLVDPAKQYGEAFRQYRELAVMALIAAFICATIAVVVVYRKLAAVSIVIPALAATVIALFLPAAFGFQLSFFSFAAALVLVGVGIDYAAFQWEAGLKYDRWTAVAVSVDAATTLLSMGLLILSNTYPVRSFGLTVTVGIAAALCLSHIPRMAARGVGSK